MYPGIQLAPSDKVIRNLLRAASLLLVFACTGCTSSEEEAQKLLTLARLETIAAQELGTREPTRTPSPVGTAGQREDNKTLQLAHYQKALELTNLIAQKFPDTLLGQGVATGAVDLGGVSLRELRETTLPQLELRVKADGDPLSAAQVIIRSLKERVPQAELQIALARSLDIAGRASESQAALREALLLSSGITNPSERIQFLSDIAITHANASRKSESLEVAFLALSSAKQVPEPEQRARALTQIALVYYTLGVEQRGYEALQSIQDKTRRAAALKEVSEKLLEKNLPHQALAASTVLFSTETRIQFLLSLAQSAAEKESSATILLFLDQSVPLISKLASPEARAEMFLAHARLMRAAGSTERALELLSQATALAEEENLATAQLLSSAALESAELGKSSETLLFSQRALALTKRLPQSDESAEARIQVLLTCATALAAADEPAKAFDALKLIEQDGPRARAYARVARLSEEKGSSGFAKRFLQEAETLLPKLTSSKERASVLLELRDSYLELHRLEEAKRSALALQQEDKKWKSYLRGFQNLLFQKDYLDEGIALARSTEDPYLRAVLLTEAAKFSFKQGAINQVVSLLEEAAESAAFGKDAARSLSLAALISDTMLQVKLPRLALTLVEKNDFSDLPVWYCRIAETYVATGQKQDAVEALYSALTATYKLSRWADRVRVLLKVGEIYSSMDLALGIQGRELLSTLLASLPEPTNQATTS